MKRFFAAILVLLVIVVGGSKVALMIGATQLVSQVKTELVSLGALNYESVSTSLQDSEIIIRQPTFKHFLLKKDFSAGQARLKFDGVFDMVLGLSSALGSNYSGLQQLSFEGFITDLPDRALYEQLSEGLNPDLGLWFGFLSCDGQASPTASSMAKAGIDKPASQVMIRFGLPNSSIEFDTPGFGRVIIEMDLLGRISGYENARLQTLTYIDNGYFKRLAQTCEHDSDDPVELSQVIVDGWSKRLAEEGYRISPAALAMVRDFIEQGGILRFIAGQAVPAPEEGIYGWHDAEFVARLDVQVNERDVVALDLQNYLAPPVVEVVSEPVQKREPAYVESPIMDDGTLTEPESLLGKQVRLTLLKGKQHEGIVKIADSRQIEIIPLNGDGKVSYTLSSLELTKLEVWVE